MFTACQARLLSTFSGIRLGLLVLSQATEADFNLWAKRLNDILPIHTNLYSDMEGIIARGIKEENFLSSEIRLSLIASSIVTFTSAFEYYLVDFITLMLSEKKLFKRGLDLKEISVNKFDIIDFDDLDKLRNKYKSQLSVEFSKGELWSKKISNAYKLFDLRFNKNDSIVQSLDSLWIYRNKVAHMNRIQHLPITIADSKQNNIIVKDLTSKEIYLQFCLQLIEIMTDGLNKVSEFESEAWKKWKE